MNIGDAVRARIIELCNERKITINKLSTICGITHSTLNNIMHREGSKPSVSTVKKICDGLEISMAQFFSAQLFDDLEQEIK